MGEVASVREIKISAGEVKGPKIKEEVKSVFCTIETFVCGGREKFELCELLTAAIVRHKSAN